MSIQNQGRKWLSALLAIGAVAFVSKSASALPTLWWTVNGQTGVLKHPASDASAWGNSYGHMFHDVQGTSELDFPVPFPTKSGGSPYQFVMARVCGSDHNGYGSYCAQLLGVGADGSVLSSPYACAPSGQSSFLLSAIPLQTSYATAFVAVWATDSAEIDAVAYGLGNYPYVQTP